MFPLDRHRAERAELERRTAEGTWGLDGNPRDRLEELQARKGKDPFGMNAIEDTAAKYEARERTDTVQYSTCVTLDVVSSATARHTNIRANSPPVLLLLPW